MRLQGVELVRAGRIILAGVDMAVGPREIVTVIGPNGAGKTSLVKIVLGLVRPGRGLVWRRPGLRLGYSPQQLMRDPSLPLAVEGFLCLGRDASTVELTRCLAEVGLADILTRPMAVLSGGELHRVLLARALLRDPDLLVLDEPLSGVDLTGQAELYKLIGQIRDRRGCGVLLVSHDLHLVMAATDRVICLDGHVCCSGRPIDVARDPAFRRLFGDGFAPILAVYEHHHACDHEHHHSSATAGELHRA